MVVVGVVVVSRVEGVVDEVSLAIDVPLEPDVEVTAAAVTVSVEVPS